MTGPWSITSRPWTIFREIKDRRGEGHTLGNLGVQYYRLGQSQQAIEYHQQALAIARKIKDRRNQTNELINLGEVYHDLGQYEQALECYRQAWSQPGSSRAGGARGRP